MAKGEPASDPVCTHLYPLWMRFPHDLGGHRHARMNLELHLGLMPDRASPNREINIRRTAASLIRSAWLIVACSAARWLGRYALRSQQFCSQQDRHSTVPYRTGRRRTAEACRAVQCSVAGGRTFKAGAIKDYKQLLVHLQTVVILALCRHENCCGSSESTLCSCRTRLTNFVQLTTLRK